jgi:hypothetical protein
MAKQPLRSTMMAARRDQLSSVLSRLQTLVVSSQSERIGAVGGALNRVAADVAATRFHLASPAAKPILAIVGGTGTGKSTLLNRLFAAELSAASFRRTFTSGPVAVARSAQDVPGEWLGLPHVTASRAEVPARGVAQTLVVVETDSPLADRAIIVDTPDLDGDQPLHHAEADRAFRWAQAAMFVVTPEKYQMTELLPYYRLAGRYSLPCWFVMNKCEEQAVALDYRKLLDETTGGISRLFVVSRDDAGYEPPAEQNLSALRQSIVAADAFFVADEKRSAGIRQRGADLLSRLTDTVIVPLRTARAEADRFAAALRAMETPEVGVDVNPLTVQLQRRLQERSVLYLMGPQRILDRVRQAPGMLMRLPSAAWQFMRTGELDAAMFKPGGSADAGQPPDFHALLADQFRVLQSRIDDLLRSRPAGREWIDSPADGYASAKIDPDAAGKIADEELADLRAWLEKRWNATPRDTRILQAMLRYLPGGKKLASWTEAAPYLLTIIVLAHHILFFGHLDLLVLGGYSIATWISERLSNEVVSRTRQTNQRIATRFTALAHDQIERTCAWLANRTPPPKWIDALSAEAAALGEVVGENTI